MDQLDGFISVFWTAAMLRRGTARKSLQQYEEACKDLEYVLSVEPGNKQAKVWKVQ